MGFLLVLPFLAPLLAAALLLVTRPGLRVSRAVTIGTCAALVATGSLLLAGVWTGGTAAIQMAGLPAPFGITLVADVLSGLMLLVTAVIGLAASVYNLDAKRPEHALHHPLLLIMLAGVDGAFVTGDLFNLYVWFEVMLIASFVLLILGKRPGQLRGAVFYLGLNLISSLLFLTAVGLLYGATGTLNLADLAERLPGALPPGLQSTLAMLFLCAFGIKAALFPLFFWLPQSYYAPPPAVAAIFAGLLTKVGVYALFRTFTLLFVHDSALTHGILLAISALTMLSGVLGAAVQTDMRRILSFHIVSQIGYMTMGLSLLTPLGVGAGVFYLIHHIIVKANLFLVVGLIARESGDSRLDAIGGLYSSRPLLAVLFAVPALSLAGVPPLSGFWAKLLVVQAGLIRGELVAVAVALLVGLLTLYSMTKIWLGAFWKPHPGDSPPRASIAVRAVPIGALALLTVVIGLWARPLAVAATRAGEELIDRTSYIRAVLGPRIEGPAQGQRDTPRPGPDGGAS